MKKVIIISTIVICISAIVFYYFKITKKPSVIAAKSGIAYGITTNGIAVSPLNYIAGQNLGTFVKEGSYEGGPDGVYFIKDGKNYVTAKSNIK